MRQIQGNTLSNTLLNSQLQRLNSQIGAATQVAPVTATQVGSTNAITENPSGTINIRLGLDPAMISQLSSFRPKSPPLRSSPELPHRAGGSVTGVIGTSETPSTAATASSWPSRENDRARPDWQATHDVQSYENARAGMLRTVHPSVRKENRVVPSAKVRQVMNLANLPLTSGLLASLSGNGDA